VTDDPRERFVRALRRELRGGPRARRRVVREVTAHLDDLVCELEGRGMARPAAVREALRRLGDAGTIAGAFREARPERERLAGLRRLRSPAWVAVGAMSLVTAWAAELPPASGAKAATPALPAIHAAHHPRVGVRDPRRDRHPGRRS
jgi:hypothetical protein